MKALFSNPTHPINLLLEPMRIGAQHLGYALGGALDRFSLSMAYARLFQRDCRPLEQLQYAEERSSSIEVIMPDQIEVQEAGSAVMLGSSRPLSLLRKGRRCRVPQGALFDLQPGDHISWGRALQGFRSYLVGTTLQQGQKNVQIQKVNARQFNVWGWAKRGKIRVVAGPEYDQFEYAQLLLEALWQIDASSNRMGMRLNLLGSADLLPALMQHKRGAAEMISQPVQDGTVQLTPSGPIILLRDRQTVGGYPRILNVIDADMDLLAHYRPGQRIRFEWVTLDEAVQASRDKEACLTEWMKGEWMKGEWMKDVT